MKGERRMKGAPPKLRTYSEKAAMKRARGVLHDKIRSGSFPKPTLCEMCNEQAHVWHHDDYRFPLQVRGLCNPCHRSWHRTNQVVMPVDET